MDLEETLCDGQLSLGAYYFIASFCMHVCPYVYVFVSIKLILPINDEWMDG